MITHVEQDRRDFLKSALAGAGACWSLGAAGAQTAAAPSEADRVAIGQTGIRASRLALGTGFRGWERQSDQTRLGPDGFDRLVHRAFERGVNVLDMADLYGSHEFAKRALGDRDRDGLVLLSKIWTTPQPWLTPSGGATAEVDRFRRELGVDYLDICLIHCMTRADWPQQQARVRDELSVLKDRDVVRALGVSCHDHGALKTAAADPWVDVIFARINHRGGRRYQMDGTTEEITETLKTARANGKFVVGMKIFGAGRLVEPEEKQASLDYVWREGVVDAVTIGMTSPEQVDDTTERLVAARRKAAG